jgi:hypothetical protein
MTLSLPSEHPYAICMDGRWMSSGNRQEDQLKIQSRHVRPTYTTNARMTEHSVPAKIEAQHPTSDQTPSHEDARRIRDYFLKCPNPTHHLVVVVAPIQDEGPFKKADGSQNSNTAGTCPLWRCSSRDENNGDDLVKGRGERA